ncbi:proline-rich transmembrane protein 1-like [Halichondria panicea]|uniref:proline-rich transmembrane protein 1-like n=1 Tax=Halichondria panicea TaxID=6063 RepID=UPI00312B9A10
MSEKLVESVPLTSKQEEAGGPPPVYPQQPVVYVSQQAIAPPSGVPRPPNDYLVMSIMTLLFCFWPLGIVALLKSIEARGAVARGDYTAAQTASKSALQLNRLAIIIGTIILFFILAIIGLSQLSWIIPLAVIRINQ